MSATDLNLTTDKLTGDEYGMEMAETVDELEEAPKNGEPSMSLGDNSTSSNSPSLHLLHDRKQYCEKCLPLYKAALKGDVEVAKCLLRNDPGMLRAAITDGYETVLHVAAGAKQTGFVAEMIKLITAEDLTLKDQNGNTAFCFAVAAGNIQIAQMMLAKNPSLLLIRGGRNMTPLYLAALFGHKDMAALLYDKGAKTLGEEDQQAIFFTSINTGLYDLALKFLKDDKDLAMARHVNYGTALHVLARNPSAFAARRPGLFKRLINSFPGKKLLDHTGHLPSTPALELVKCLWTEIMQRDDVDFKKLIKSPTRMLFDAAELGNYEFLAELIGYYPDLVHEMDENDRSIFHIAVLHRHQNIFNLIHEIGFNKELIASYVDKYGNNLLHLAAEYPPPNPVGAVADAASEMQRELLTLKEVEKLVQPSFREMKNSKGQTPNELFTVAHAELLKSAEHRMKSTAKTCVLVATLVATVVFAATVSVPVGDKNETGKYVSIKKTLFQVFAVTDAIALSSSSIAVLAFLSILTSQFTENEFLKSLPVKMMVGLSSLFISLITMMLAFSTNFFQLYHDGLN